MRALVTGGAGFIGSHICEALLSFGHDVICLDNFDPYYDPAIKRRNIASMRDEDGFDLVVGDVRDSDLITGIVRDHSVEYVFHGAAGAGVRASLSNPEKAHGVNATGTLSILRACLDGDVKKVINMSSSSVYGRIHYLPFDESHPLEPLSPYGVSKLMGEHYCRVFSEVYGLKTVSLRYFTVYGPRMRPDLAIFIFTRNALRNQDIEIFGDGTRTRDFTYIDDAVDVTLKAMNAGTGVFNIGSGARISVLDLAKKIIELTGSDSRIVHGPAMKGEAEHTWADCTKAKRELDFSPKTSLDEGLGRFIRWMTSTSQS